MTGRNDRDEEGRGALRDLLPVLTAPSALRRRVRDSLLSRGVIAPARPRRWRWVALAAAAGLCFAAGLLAGRATSATPSGVVVPRYALLLYGGLEGDTGSVNVSRAEEYGRWAASLSGDARFVSGAELGRVVGELPSPRTGVSDPSEPVAGFFLIDARSDEVATRIAASCPHLKYGGRVVVQAIGAARS